jgi:methyl-accepting chemotaxis protein
MKVVFMLNSLSIRIKIGVALSILTGTTVITGFVGHQGLEELRGNSQLVATQLMPAQSAILNADRDLYQALTAQMNALLLPDSADLKSQIDTFDENAQQAFDRMHTFLDAVQPFPAIVKQFEDFDSQFNAWRQSARQIFDLIKQGKHDEALTRNNVLHEQFDQLRDRYNTAGEVLEQRSDAIANHSDDVAVNNQNITLFISAFSLLLGIGLIYFIPKSISNSIARVRHQIDDISKGGGDLISRIPVISKDELGTLSISFNALLDQLQRLIRQVSHDVGSLEQSTDSLKDIAQNVELTNEQQTAQLSSLSGAFSDIGHAVSDITGNAINAASKSQEAEVSARDGLGKIDRTIALNRQLSDSIQTAGDRVEALSTDSEQITSVLDVIRNIADQTNLLALNAAIEAARAGDQGRGFAVVADEVRTLAQRTQNSTKDIQTMISNLKEGVVSTKLAMDKGCELMTDSVDMTADLRHTFENIQHVVSAVQDMNAQIASAAEQQSSIMEGVSGGVDSLQALTLKQSEAAESVARTGGNVSSLAHQLSSLMHKFKV